MVTPFSFIEAGFYITPHLLLNRAGHRARIRPSELAVVMPVVIAIPDTI